MEDYRKTAYYKQVLKNFWKRKWVPGRSKEVWIEICNKPNGGAYALKLIHTSFEKLYFENFITKDEKSNMQKMFKGTEEDQYLVLSIIEGFKPKVFSRRDKSKVRPVKEKTTFDDVRNRFCVANTSGPIVKYK